MIRLRDPATGAEAQWDGCPPTPHLDPPNVDLWSGDPVFIRDVLLPFIRPGGETGATMQRSIRGQALGLGLQVVRETQAPDWVTLDGVGGP